MTYNSAAYSDLLGPQGVLEKLPFAKPSYLCQRKGLPIFQEDWLVHPSTFYCLLNYNAKNGGISELVKLVKEFLSLSNVASSNSHIECTSYIESIRFEKKD